MNLRLIKKEERRRQLLNAAIQTFGTNGYYRTQISDIIEEAGVARGTFYLYFKSKRDIFDCLMSELFQKVRNEVQTLPRDAVLEIPKQLIGNIERITNLLLNEPWMVKLLFSESVGLDDELDERLRRFYGQILALIHRALKQGQDMGFVREGNLDVLSTALLGSLKEIFYQYFLGTQKPDRSGIVNELYQIVVNAIATPQLRPQLQEALKIAMRS